MISPTFVVTEDCNFRCTYCYVLKKSPRRMPFSVARAAVDYILEHRDLFPEHTALWTFIGGEPLLEIELITQIVDYIKRRASELDHPLLGGSSFRISSNGSLYGRPEVQRLIETHGNTISVQISIDGPQHVHDLHRVTPDGRGTHQQVVANIPLWLRQNPPTPHNNATMVLVHRNLRFLAQSVLYLFSLGIKHVRAKMATDDVWLPGDDEIFEAQLDLLGQGILERRLWRKHNCSLLLNRDYLASSPRPSLVKRSCPAGRRHMYVDAAGGFYPCGRFMDVALTNQLPRTIGNVKDGLDLNRLRPFIVEATGVAKTPAECMDCELATTCPSCVASDYDLAETPTIFQRGTQICLMHKAKVRANRRYWAKVDEMERKDRMAVNSRQKQREVV